MLDTTDAMEGTGAPLGVSCCRTMVVSHGCTVDWAHEHAMPDSPRFRACCSLVSTMDRNLLQYDRRFAFFKEGGQRSQGLSVRKRYMHRLTVT